ncbi:MAG: O-antigen ligase family protein [Phycisphaerales bacterium]|nr:O-antigen ligase family protein [Phycisphaerales bacterium]
MDRPLPYAAELRLPATPRRHDDQILSMLFLPGLFVAGLLYAGGATQPAAVVAGVTVLLTTLIAPEIGIYVYLASAALDQLLLEEEGSILTPAKILGPFVLLAYVAHPGRTRIPILASKPFLFVMLAFGIYGIVTAMFSIAWLASVRYAGQISVQVLIIIVAIHRLSDRDMIARALQFCVAGGLIGGLILVVFGSRSMAFSGATLGPAANPNSTALALSVPLAVVPAAWAMTRNRFLRIAIIAAGPIILTGMMMTGSRSALIAVFGSALLGLAFTRRASAAQRILIPVTAAVVIAATTYFVLGSGVLGERPQERINALLERGVAAREESRYEIWMTAFRTFLSKPWGFGYGNTAFALEARTGVFIDIHSTMLSALVDGGVASFGLFVVGLYLLWRAIWSIRFGLYGLPATMLFMFTMLSSLTHTIHFSKWFWIPLTICALLAEQARRDQLAGVEPDRPRRLTPEEILKRLQPGDAVVYR